MIRWLAMAGLVAFEASAIVLFGTADAERNTSAPVGEFANSGWELQGEWGLFSGTPIGRRHFITAAHVGGAIGQEFFFRGASYRAVASWTDAGSDLRIFEVARDFPEFARLYDGEDEVGKTMMVLGRGAGRGTPVFVGEELKGWRWGAWDRRLRWGTNVVSALMADRKGDWTGKITLEAKFDAGAGDDEAHLAVGDSGGAVFIKQDAEWRLAGINYTVDGPFLDPQREGDVEMLAALFDMRGVRIPGGETPSGLDVLPSRLYATRIKARLDWIRGVLALPTTPVVWSSTAAEGPFAVSEAAVDVAGRTVRVAIGESAMFFLLESSPALTMKSARVEGGEMVFEY